MLFRLKREGRPERTLELTVTPSQVLRWMAGAPLWDAMPELNYDQREFLLSGAGPDDLASILAAEPIPAVASRTFVCELRELAAGDIFTIYPNGSLYMFLGSERGTIGRYRIANQDGLVMTQDGIALVYPIQRDDEEVVQTAWARALR